MHDIVPGTITFPGNKDNSKPGSSKQAKSEDLATFLFRNNLPAELNGVEFYQKMKQIHSELVKE